MVVVVVTVLLTYIYSFHVPHPASSWLLEGCYLLYSPLYSQNLEHCLFIGYRYILERNWNMSIKYKNKIILSIYKTQRVLTLHRRPLEDLTSSRKLNNLTDENIDMNTYRTEMWWGGMRTQTIWSLDAETCTDQRKDFIMLNYDQVHSQKYVV